MRRERESGGRVKANRRRDKRHKMRKMPKRQVDNENSIEHFFNGYCSIRNFVLWTFFAACALEPLPRSQIKYLRNEMEFVEEGIKDETWSIGDETIAKYRRSSSIFLSSHLFCNYSRMRKWETKVMLEFAILHRFFKCIRLSDMFMSFL